MSTTLIQSGNKIDPDTLTRVRLFQAYLQTELGKADALDPAVQTNALPANCITGPQAVAEQSGRLAGIVSLYGKSYGELADDLKAAGYAVQPFPANRTDPTNYTFLQEAVISLGEVIEKQP